MTIVMFRHCRKFLAGIEAISGWREGETEDLQYVGYFFGLPLAGSAGSQMVAEKIPDGRTIAERHVIANMIAAFEE